MVNLQLITSKNCWVISKLKADEKFVATNQESMMEAYAYYVENGFGPIAYGVYYNENAVGFVMAEYQNGDREEDFNNGKPYYFLWRMMIDNSYQGKGYGKEALSLLLQEVKKFPNGFADKIFTSVVPENLVATKFYEGFGFVKTGGVNEGEEIMELEI